MDFLVGPEGGGRNVEAEGIPIRTAGHPRGRRRKVQRRIGAKDAGGGGKPESSGGLLRGEERVECGLVTAVSSVMTQHMTRAVLFPADIVTSLRNVSPRG